MTDQPLAAVTLVLSAACLVAAVLCHRVGNAKRDVRLVAGSGAALGGLAWVLFSITGA